MTYRKQIIESIKELLNIRDGIFTQTINLSMSGQLNDINKTFDVGEVYNFDIKHFENSEDINVVELLNAFKKIEEVI